MKEQAVKGNAKKKTRDHTAQIRAGILCQKLNESVDQHGKHEQEHDRNAETAEKKDGRDSDQNPCQFSRASRTDWELASVPVERPVWTRVTPKENP